MISCGDFLNLYFPDRCTVISSLSDRGYILDMLTWKEGSRTVTFCVERDSEGGRLDRKRK